MRCKVQGCDNESFAKGYCKKHYFRFIRNGDPEKTKKRGRKKDIYRNTIMAMFQNDYSTRTIDKLIKCFKVMHSFPKEEAKEILMQAKRDNGRVNIEKLERLIDGKIVDLYLSYEKKAHDDEQKP